MPRRSLILAAVALLPMLAGGCARIEDAAFNAGLEAERLRSGAEARTLQLDWGRLDYLERPGDGPTLLLVHGFGAEKDLWLAFVRELPEDYRVIIPDLPGHGEASMPPEEVRLTDAWYAAQLGEVVSRLQLPAHHVVGNSLGGLIALRHVLAQPDQVLSLALLAPAGMISPQPSAMELLLTGDENPLIVEDGNDFDRLLGLIYHDQPLVPWPARPALIRRLSDRSAFLARLWHDLWNYSSPIDEDLHEIRAPTLILWGRQDRVLDVSAAELFQQRIADARLVVFDAVGHSPMSEEPERTALVWLEFVADIDSQTNDMPTNDASMAHPPD
jgi:pimeloyl-ACP methyl ester carboxylesterase